MGRLLYARHGRGLTVALLTTLAALAALFGPLASAPCLAAAPVDPQSTTIQLAGLEDQFAQLARSVSPVVVAISASCVPVEGDDIVRSEELNPERLDRVLARTTRTVGTGFVIDADGYILTNEHVVGEAEQLWVTTDDRRVYPAMVIGSDPRADLAILKIPATGLPVARFADAPVRRGQWSITLGNPYGLASEGELAMSVGVISATDRSLPKLASRENRLYTNLIQTTAEINPGNSGGPLFNLAGEVIGVNTAVILPQKQTNGIGFALPVTPALLETVAGLKAGNEIVYGYLGVLVSTPTTKELRATGLVDGSGARVDSIEAGSPASATALRVGDVIASISGLAVHGSDHFVRVVGRTAVEAPVPVVVYRDGKRVKMDVTLRRRELPAVAVTRVNQRLRWRGMVLAPLPAHWQGNAMAAASTRPGLIVIGIDDASPMATRGITSGTVITSVAGKAVSTLADLQRILEGTPADACEVEIADMAVAHTSPAESTTANAASTNSATVAAAVNR